MYKGCIFDLDGTLCNTLDSIAYIANTSLAALGLPPIDTQEYRYMVGNGADTLMRRMLARTKPGFSEEDIAALRNIYDETYAADPMVLVAAYPGIPALIAELRAQGVKIAVLSNKPDDMTKATVYPLFGKDTFDFVWGQTDRFPTKPNPAAVLELVRLLGLPKDEVLYIGDTGTDMDTGKNAGLTTAGVLWGFRDETELKAHSACHLAGTADELRALIFKG